MKNKTCYLCGGRKHEAVPGKVRDRPAIAVKRCADCGLVFLESFDHIKEDYYSEDYNDETHGGESWQHLINRCRTDDQRRAADLEAVVANKNFLDIGCGAGGLLLLLKDRCRRAAGIESSHRWRESLSAAGVPVREDLDGFKGETFDVISLFMVLEHIREPIPFLRRLGGMLSPGGQLIIEVPNSDDALLSLYKSKPFSEFTYWSPHLFFYNRPTLARLVKKAGLRLNYLRHIQRYPVSNHLRWLSEGKPGGHIDWSFLNSPELAQAYAQRLAALGITDTVLASACLP